MITRADVANVHHRLLGERLRIRQVLNNLTTVETAIVQGARVRLHKQDNAGYTSPHYAYYFSAVLDGVVWASREWHVKFNPTRMSGRQARDDYHAALAETVSYLAALPDAEPPRCGHCGEVLIRRNTRAKYCSNNCRRNAGHHRRYQRKRSA